MHSLLVICGPTATGKTALAVKLAKKYHGELISADSRQVYQGMDIGTGKDIENNSKFITCHSEHIRFTQCKLREESQINDSKNKYSLGYYQLNNIPLWLLDIVNPDKFFSVADYQKLAWIIIKDIWKRKKIPIIVGGTGLYIKSIIDGFDTVGIPQNLTLRKKLNKLSLLELQKKLLSQNPQKFNSMNYSDQQNPRRLIRSIEITKFQEQIKATPLFVKASPLQTLQIGLTAPNPILYQRIDERVEKRVKQGIINEIKSLQKKGYSWDLPSMSGLGYRVWRDYFKKRKTLEETIQIWKYQEHDYARRQLTWFKKDKRIKWFDITDKNVNQKIKTTLSTWC